MANTVTKSKLSMLELVYPPMSNQEAVWFQNDPEVEALLRQSDFYMIGGRAEAKFSILDVNTESETATFNFIVGDRPPDPVELHFRELPNIASPDPEDYYLEAGEKIIRLWDGPVKADGSSVLEWFTTEKLLWDRSRDMPGIGGLHRYREFATYDLLYVGIAKKGDSFDRLIAHGHRARMEILANEAQRYPGARVTDETFLFLFRVSPLVIQKFDLDHEFSEDDLSGKIDNKRIVADAEKAFVSLLKPQYNMVKFGNYPRGADSLYGGEYLRYGYVIQENIAFNTPHGRMKGARKHDFLSNDADFIFVDGEKVTFFESGVDFPGDAPKR